MKWVAYSIWLVVWLLVWGQIGPILDYGTGSPIAHGLGFLVWIAVLWFGFKIITGALAKKDAP